MAISKVIFNGDTLMDVTGDNPATDNMLTGTRATGADGVTVNGAVVTAPASTADPAMDGTASPGTASTYSRGDHVHPTDTGRQAKITASGILKGNGSGGVSAAVAGTDYIADVSGKLDKSGGTMTGALTLSGAPTSNLHAATKKYVDDSIPSVPSATSTSPKMDGTAAVGSETTWAKGDHVHPTDTSRQAKITASGMLKGDGSGGVTAAVAGTDYIASHQDISGKLDKAGDTMTGALTLSGAPTNNLHAATKKYVDDSIPAVPSASTTTPSMDGTASYGSGTTWARADHVHPTDTSRAPTSHATNATTYGTGTDTNYGHLKLSASTSSTSGTSGGIAATPSAVKAVNDRITYGNTDLTAGTSALTTGVLYAYYT